MPTSSARRAWCCRCRRSPWTGMNHRGRTRESISRSSSGAAWPLAWTASAGTWKTSPPVRYRPSTTRWIAGSLPGIREDDRTTRVVRAELHPLVLARGHQGQRRERLSLGAGADDDHAARVEPVDLLDRDDVLVRDVQEPEPPRGLDALLHRAPQERDHPFVAPRRVHDLLDAMDVAGEARDHDDVRRLLDDALQDRADAPLALGVSRPPRRSSSPTGGGGRRCRSPLRRARAGRSGGRRAASGRS